MEIKLVIAVLILFIIVSLFKALFVMIKNDGKVPMSHYLGRRLLFSAAAVAIILIGVSFGFITPNSSPI